MTDQHGDVRLERALRDVLARRDPGPQVPTSVLDRIDALTATEPVGGRLRWLGAPAARRLPAIAGLAAAAVLALLAVTIQATPVSVGPGATPDPGTPFDPTRPTAGILREPSLIPASTAAFIVLAIPVILGRRPNRWRVAGALGVGALSIGLFVVMNHRAPVIGLVYSPILGMTSGADGSALEPDEIVVTAAPGEPFAIAFGVRNVGWTPVRIDGFVDPLAGVPGQHHWTGVWIGAADDPGASIDPADARPFQPFDLAPDAFRVVFLVGQAGECAVGRPAGPEDGRLGLPIRTVYSVLGVTRVGSLVQAELDIPWFEVLVPTRVGCSPSG